MEEKKKLFEVILSPSDMLEKELENVLGGMGICSVDKCEVNNGDCKVNYCKENFNPWCDSNSCIKNQYPCPPGTRWDPNTCSCVPIEG